MNYKASVDLSTINRLIEPLGVLLIVESWDGRGNHRPTKLHLTRVEDFEEAVAASPPVKTTGEPTAVDAIVALYRCTRDKASNGAWGDHLCKLFNFDVDAVRGEAYGSTRRSRS